MKKGTRVSWTLKNGDSGSGVTICDELDGHVAVAVESLAGPQEMHYVIYCAVTWLTPLDTAESAPAAATEGTQAT